MSRNTGSGFSKSKFNTIIRIPLQINVNNVDNGEESSVNVVHVFKLPTAKVREQHQRMLVKVKGRRVTSAGTQDAHFYLWRECILKVEGYDDLVKDPTHEDLVRYFDDDIGRLHVEPAVEALLSRISAEETDEEKKLEPSSVQ